MKNYRDGFIEELKATDRNKTTFYKNPFNKIPEWESFAERKKYSFEYGIGNILIPTKNMFMISEGFVPPETFDEIFYGYKEVVNSIEEAFGKMSLHEPVIFMSDEPTGNEGFWRHSDQNDRFHWNCIGSSHWYIWDRDTDEEQEFILDVGDLLYIPFRTDHQVRSLTEKRGAITVIMHGV